MYVFMSPLAFPLNNNTPTIIVSGMATVYNLVGNPYDAYVSACFITPGQTYEEGYNLGYSLLTSGLAPDIPLVLAMNQIKTARINKGQTPNFGNGTMDVWRLLVESPLDIQAVINGI